MTTCTQPSYARATRGTSVLFPVAGVRLVSGVALPVSAARRDRRIVGEQIGRHTAAMGVGITGGVWHAPAFALPKSVRDLTTSSPPV